MDTSSKDSEAECKITNLTKIRTPRKYQHHRNNSERQNHEHHLNHESKSDCKIFLSSPFPAGACINSFSGANLLFFFHHTLKMSVCWPTFYSLKSHEKKNNIAWLVILFFSQPNSSIFPSFL